jgi:hypothetical protein
MHHYGQMSTDGQYVAAIYTPESRSNNQNLLKVYAQYLRPLKPWY